MLDRGRLLELGHHRGASGDQLLQLGDIVGVLHEGQRHPVDAERQAVVEVPAVLGRHGRQRQHEVGQVDAFAVADRAGDLDHRVDRVAGVRDDAQPHLAIVDQQQPIGLGRLEDLWMRQRHALDGARRLVHVEPEILALLQLDGPLRHRAQSQLGALQVHQDGDRVLVLLLQRTQQLDPLLVVLRRAVAEVEAEDVGAGLEQFLQPFRAGGGRPERGHDLGEALAEHAASLAQTSAWGMIL